MSLAIDGAVPPLLTPAGLQDTRELTARRRLVGFACTALCAAMLLAVGQVLAADGWRWTDGVMLLGLLLALPWTVLGLCNAVLGLWLLHGTRDGLMRVAPFAAAGTSAASLHIRTAILLTLRNEDSARAFARLQTVRDSLTATGEGRQFAYFVLSDSSLPEIVAQERSLHTAMAAADVTYRHRPVNTGFKAGSLRSFCAEHGRDFELMLPLDADSLMDGPSIVRLVRIMQAHPRHRHPAEPDRGAAIAQRLRPHLPVRHAPRACAATPWAAPGGPAIAARSGATTRWSASRRSVTQCNLPMLSGGPPLGGARSCRHDQIEAALMRRAGYEVRRAA